MPNNARTAIALERASAEPIKSSHPRSVRVRRRRSEKIFLDSEPHPGYGGCGRVPAGEGRPRAPLTQPAARATLSHRWERVCSGKEKKMPPVPTLSRETIERARQMYREGARVRDICAATGMRVGTLY